MLIAILVSGFSALLSALVAVDFVCWRRTLALRSGHAEPIVTDGTAKLRSSRTTFLAAASGAVAAAAAAAHSTPTPSSLALAAVGAWIAAAGLWSRVTALEVDEAGFTIRYARRRAYRLAWKDCRGLAPPRWPLGGWCLRAEDRGRTLMPSDVVGNEDVLRRLVQASGLSFDGREWRSRAYLSR
jgi:hypothetical protein